MATFLLATFVLGVAAFSSAVPPRWSIHHRADPQHILPLKISLAQSNIQNLDAYLLNVSDPLSPTYGQHWTPERVVETFRPSQEAIDVVFSWLINEGDLNATQVTQTGGDFQVTVSVAQAEVILGYNLPDHVSKHVDFITSTAYPGYTISRRSTAYRISGPRRPARTSKTFIEESKISKGLRDCDKVITLDCIRALYDFNYDLVSTHKNTVAIGEFGPNFLRFQDLDKFFKKFAPNVVGHRPKVFNIDGARLDTSDTNATELGEASLDFELVMGLLGHKQEVRLYQAGILANDPTSGDELLGALDASYCRVEGVAELGLKDCGDKPRSNVLSVSYTSLPDVRDPAILPMLQRECAEIGKLALLGITVIASSGDNGVSFNEQICSVNGTLTPGNPRGSFVGSFPASCPYVTAVGSTTISPGKTVHDPEVATTSFPSGGGFSNAFARPDFQNTAVNHYLKQYAPSYAPDVFNRSGRAYPDVAANGDNIAVVVDGDFGLSGGTSASAPIFAAIITAVNDARLAVGKRPVGWINPALYSHAFARAFNDITNGSNPGCGTEGFPAAPGWDPVTGLGTPNFRKLLRAFLSLP